MPLSQEKCSVCSDKTVPLSVREISNLQKEVPAWGVREKRLEREFSFENFVEAMKFANRVTKIAEKENHHPDLHISWGKVRIELTTHKIDGLSKNDFILAAKIDKMAQREDQAQSI